MITTWQLCKGGKQNLLSRETNHMIITIKRVTNKVQYMSIKRHHTVTVITLVLSSI